MIREFTCIICPNGCEISATIENGEVLKTSGSSCKKGVEYVVQEIKAPKRTISSSIKVIGGDLPLVSVRLTDYIPKEKIFEVMDEIKKIEVEAPTHIGQIVIENVLGLGSDVVITKNISEQSKTVSITG